MNSYKHRGFSYMQTREYAKARADLEKALRLSP
ncbi:MAG: tetratricopeptide repeat protein [Treponema sp.]|nr:tetratricopeptide repeat protein [Treponema sp.]